MNLRLVCLLLAIPYAISCGASASDVKDTRVDAGKTGQKPVALPDAGDCALVLLRPSETGCIAEWSCRDAGVLVLACGPTSLSSHGGPDGGDGGQVDAGAAMGDGGFGCACGSEAQSPMAFGQAPTSCTEDGVRQFGRQMCGWSGL